MRIPHQRVVDHAQSKDVRPPPGLALPEAHAPTFVNEIDVAVDADGIARLVPLVGTADHAALPSYPDGSASALLGRELTAAEVEHSAADGVTLAQRVGAALGSGEKCVIVRLRGHCSESEPLDISRGDVILQGDADSGRVQLNIPSLRVTGGSLVLQDVALYAAEENQVKTGQLACKNCFITSRNGCGILCLQKAKVFLTGCEIAHCMRSGIGVNGKHTEIELSGCVLKQNNFSGIGVNHQARSISLRQNLIADNGYHGVWLNVGVTVQWMGGEMTGNRLSDKGGPGLLHGYPDERRDA